MAPDYQSKSQVKRIAAQMGQPFKEFLDEQMRDPEFAEAFKAADIEVEHARLQSAVAEAAKLIVAMERAADEGSNTITRTEALIKMQEGWKVQREAVDALIAFEAGLQIENV